MQNPNDLTAEEALDAYQEMYENYKASEEAVGRLEEATRTHRQEIEHLIQTVDRFRSEISLLRDIKKEMEGTINAQHNIIGNMIKTAGL